MAISWEWLFWTCLLLVAHTYLLYPLALFVLFCGAQVRNDWRYLRGRAERRRLSLATPSITLVVPAHNEERHLPAKLDNLRALDYPRDRLQIVLVSDGSTDGTVRILEEVNDPHIETVLLPVRAGKPTALNYGVARARHDILVLSDAATLFRADALRNLVRHFVDPRVGVVCGALEFRGSAESQRTEGVYWDYEKMLRLMEGRLGATLTASGAIYAARRSCYPTLAPDVVVEDLIVPMHARRLGYQVAYDPEAVATDVAAPNVAGEFARRVRVAAGSFRALGQLARVPLDPLTSFAFISHKLLRWLLPFMLIGLLASSACLSADPWYRVAFVGQVAFYAWAAMGWCLRRRVAGMHFALMAYYLLAMHVAFLVGLARALAGRNEVVWRRVG